MQEIIFSFMNNVDGAKSFLAIRASLHFVTKENFII